MAASRCCRAEATVARGSSWNGLLDIRAFSVPHVEIENTYPGLEISRAARW